MARILVVDDEEMIRVVIREYAIYEGHEIIEAETGMKAIELCREEDFDVIIMDLMMPGLDGFTTYDNIKKIKDIPALVLSAKGDEYDKLCGFRLGIDDYVVKPFSPRELMARVGVIVSRNSQLDKNVLVIPENLLKFENLVIDSNKRQVFVNGIRVHNITRKEYEILYFLASHANMVFSREQILNNVWGFDYIGDGRTVDAHIKMLRNTLGECRRYISTVRGIGYMFDVEEI